MNILTEERYSARVHSLVAYITAIGAFLAFLVFPEQNLEPWRWLGGWLLFETPPMPDEATVRRVMALGPVLWVLHFVRRIVEVLWVHEYRRKASLAQFVFATSSYLFYALCVAHTLRGDSLQVVEAANDARPRGGVLDLSLLVGLGLFLIGEAGNGYSHLQLSQVQRASEATSSWGKPQSKVIMHGGLFEYVTCAHFAYEVLSWLGFALACRGAGGSLLVFIWSAGGLTMMAHDRHRGYKAYFNGSSDDRPLYPRSRFAIIPYVF